MSVNVTWGSGVGEEDSHAVDVLQSNEETRRTLSPETTEVRRECPPLSSQKEGQEPQ